MNGDLEIINNQGLLNDLFRRLLHLRVCDFTQRKLALTEICSFLSTRNPLLFSQSIDESFQVGWLLIVFEQRDLLSIDDWK